MCEPHLYLRPPTADEPTGQVVRRGEEDRGRAVGGSFSGLQGDRLQLMSALAKW